MTTKPRPTLDSLSSRFAKKEPPAGAVAPAPAPEVTPEAAPLPLAGRAPKDSRVQILTRIDPATRKRLKVIAAEQDRTIQDICEEAIRDFVGRHSK